MESATYSLILELFILDLGIQVLWYVHQSSGSLNSFVPGVADEWGNINKHSFIIDREAREIMYLVASVRPSVRPSVSALTAEPFDLRP